MSLHYNSTNLEVRGLEALHGGGPLGRVVHEQEIEQAKPGLGQPGELLLDVVVWLLLQVEVLVGDVNSKISKEA